ncbi:MAG: hypothetical protein LIO60_04750 [Oscillospiraceae bacterium]|nr:hypothetical protein [Oscillospiraceae bacterium]
MASLSRESVWFQDTFHRIQTTPQQHHRLLDKIYIIYYTRDFAEKQMEFASPPGQQHLSIRQCRIYRQERNSVALAHYGQPVRIRIHLYSQKRASKMNAAALVRPAGRSDEKIPHRSLIWIKKPSGHVPIESAERGQKSVDIAGYDWYNRRNNEKGAVGWISGR